MNRDQTIAKLKDFTAPIKALGATSLFLFGSMSRNENNSDSDLDLFVDYDPSGTFNALDLVDIKLLLEEKLGMELTSAYQLIPEQSTAAILVHHPQAKYYAVRTAAEGP